MLHRKMQMAERVMPADGKVGRGYIVGGGNSDLTYNYNNVRGVVFATEAAHTTSATMQYGGRDHGVVSSPGTGYFSGGYDNGSTTALQKYNASAESITTNSTSMSVATYANFGLQNAVKGHLLWGVGNINFGVTSHNNAISFPSGTCVGTAKTVTACWQKMGASASGPDHGYTMCGQNDIQGAMAWSHKFPFATETPANGPTFANTWQSCIGYHSTTKAYRAGGYKPTVTFSTEVHTIDFATDTIAATTALTGNGRNWATSVQNDLFALYVGGIDYYKNMPTAAVKQVFATDTTSTSSFVLGEGRQRSGGLSL